MKTSPKPEGRSIPVRLTLRSSVGAPLRKGCRFGSLSLLIAAGFAAPAGADPAGLLCRFRAVVSTDDAGVSWGRARLDHGVMYTAGDGGIVAFDVSDPDQPTELGRWNTPGFVGDLEFAAGRMFVAVDDVGLVVLDWSDPTTPRQTAMVPFHSYVRGLHVEDDVLLLGHNGGLSVFNVSDPDAPLETGRVYDSRVPTDVLRVGDLAYTVENDRDLKIWDLSSGPNPVFVSRFTLFGSHRFVTDGDRVFVACRINGLAMLDLTDPADPRAEFTMQTPGWAEDLAAEGDTLYVADRARGLLVLDISDPANPEMLGSYETEGEASGVVLLPGRAILPHTDARLVTIDLSTPVTREGTARVTGIPSALGGSSSGTTVVLASGTAGVLRFDLTAPGGPALLSQSPTLQAAYDAQERDGLLFVADNTAGLVVVNPLAPHPGLVGSLDTPGRARAIAVHADHAYLASGFDGVQIVNISNPAAPSLVNGIATGAAIRVRVRNNRLIISDNDGGTRIYGLTDPASPTLLGVVPSAASFDADLEGDFLFVADYLEGLLVYDVSDPADPVLVDRSPGISAARLTVGSDRVVVTDGPRGIRVYERPTPESVRLVGLGEDCGNLSALLSTPVGVFGANGGLWSFDLSDCPPCPADLADPFGVLNFFDLAAYLQLYNANDSAADLAAPAGTINFFDLAFYVGSYNAGCP